MRVLIVEDEPKMASLIRQGLRDEGIVADIAPTGEEGLELASAKPPYDAMILDLMLPGIDGFEVCRRLREREVWTPVLILTARDAVPDRVKGLDSGGDDYLVKPFAYEELLARLRALVRRGPLERPTQLKVGDLRLDPATHKAWRGDQEIELSAKEFAILETFMRRPGIVVSRDELLQQAWEYEGGARSNVVDSYVRLVRNKIDRPFGADSIETLRGAGYRLREDAGR